MRLTVARLRRVVKADLPIEFVPQQLTSYGGLELLRRYFRLLGQSSLNVLRHKFKLGLEFDTTPEVEREGEAVWTEAPHGCPLGLGLLGEEDGSMVGCWPGLSVRSATRHSIPPALWLLTSGVPVALGSGRPRAPLGLPKPRCHSRRRKKIVASFEGPCSSPEGSWTRHTLFHDPDDIDRGLPPRYCQCRRSRPPWNGDAPTWRPRWHVGDAEIWLACARGIRPGCTRPVDSRLGPKARTQHGPRTASAGARS